MLLRPGRGRDDSGDAPIPAPFCRFPQRDSQSRTPFLPKTLAGEYTVIKFILKMVVVLCVAGVVNGQAFVLTGEPLHVGGTFSLTATGGPPNQIWHIGFDGDGGPTQTSIGTLDLGFSSQFFMVPWLQLDALGTGSIMGSAGTALPGDVIHAQAAANDPASATGAKISAAFVGGVHPPTPGGSANNLILGDDDSKLVDLGMAFPFYGATWTECYVGSNGFVTFGGGNFDPSEQISDFMAGLPKIAALWDDLSPQIQGSVHVEAGAGWIRIVWTGVPQFYVLDNNSAELTLWGDGRIQLHWPHVDLADGMVGIGPGLWQGTPTFADFNANPAHGWSVGAGPVFEQFLPASKPFDLHGAAVTFFPEPAGSYYWVR